MAPKSRSPKSAGPTAAEKALVQRYDRLTQLIACATTGTPAEELLELANHLGMTVEEVASCAKELGQMTDRVRRCVELMQGPAALPN